MSPVNHSESLLTEILGELKKQNLLLETINLKLSLKEEVSDNESERRENFRKDMEQLREMLNKSEA